MAKQALLHFKNVKKSFSGNVVLSGVDFEIFPGQIVALEMCIRDSSLSDTCLKCVPPESGAGGSNALC